ncbi:MAG: pseudouridine synthase [Thiobacillus sp.]|nr:pseudouridine synthase [Thiobacillus sp.]
MKVRLARALQSQGFGSRRGCILRVRRGEIAVNGEVCENPDAEFDAEGLVFTLDGADWPYRERAYLVMHKPAGYECSHKPSHHPSVFSLLPAPLVERGVQCIGRLDQDTTGLLLFTDDGQFQHRMISPKKQVAKHYRAACADAVSDAQLAALCAGVQLNDEPAPVAALAAERLDGRSLRLVLAEGKYHQVRRMVAAAGNHVTALHREAVGAYRLPDDLAPGAWRWLDAEGLSQLEQPWPSATY